MKEATITTTIIINNNYNCYAWLVLEDPTASRTQRSNGIGGKIL